MDRSGERGKPCRLGLSRAEFSIDEQRFPDTKNRLGSAASALSWNSPPVDEGSIQTLQVDNVKNSFLGGLQAAVVGRNPTGFKS